MIAWLLLARVVVAWLIAPPDSQFRPRPLTPLVVVWCLAMLVMQIALLVGHANAGLSTGQTIKSSIGWAKGWALLAIFPLLGACLNIRACVLYRAVGWVALQTLVLLPVMIIAPMVGVPETLYVSPLKVVGGSSPNFFEVQLYGHNPGGGYRWRFFTPWATAAAVAFGMMFVLLLRDRSLMIRAAGVCAMIAVTLMCQSRLGFVAVPTAVLLTFALARMTDPRMIMLGAVAALTFGIFGPGLIEYAIEQKERIDQMRQDSSYVRAILARMALYRWETEAPIWGHGILEHGSHLVEFMAIGSHHSWYGLLFVKGIVGFFALLIPLIYTFGELIVRAQMSRTARAALAGLLLFTLFTFTENVEILAYLIWPWLMIVGLASAQRLVSPLGRITARTPLSLAS